MALGRMKLYFAVLHLHPIDLTVTFKYTALQVVVVVVVVVVVEVIL